MRAFVSVDLPRGAGRTGAPEPAPAHFTLLFLADLPRDRAGPLAAALRERAGASTPFRVSFGGVGAFPDVERPRVIYLAVAEGADELAHLADAARAAADAVGVVYDARPFVAHYTLLRVRGPRDRRRALAALSSPPTAGPEPFVVDRLHLKESQLGPGGAVHTIVATVPLAGSGTPSRGTGEPVYPGVGAAGPSPATSRRHR